MVKTIFLIKLDDSLIVQTTDCTRFIDLLDFLLWTTSTECFPTVKTEFDSVFQHQIRLMERPMALNDDVYSCLQPNTCSSTTVRQCYMPPEQKILYYSNQDASTSNQKATNQPITNNINQESMQPSYSEIASNNVPPPKKMNFLKLKIVPPFNKDRFATKNTFKTASNECTSAILRQFSPQQRTKITLSKTLTRVGTRLLNTFHLVAPTQATDTIERLQSTGSELLGRTVFPQSDSFEIFTPGIYPKFNPIRILQLPSLCQDEELQEFLELPESTQITSVRHNTEENDGMNFYKGKFSAMIRVVSKEHEETLRQWSIKNHENGTLQWNDIPIYAFIPTVNQCQHWKDHRRPFHGEDIACSRHAKEETQLRTITPPNNRNQDVSVPPSNQTTIQEVSTPTTEETIENNMTQNETSDSNKDNNDNQVDLDTDNDADHDPQHPWQTASTHPRKTTSANKSQSQKLNFKHTKRKSDNNKERLFKEKNLLLHTSVTKKKEPSKGNFPFIFRNECFLLELLRSKRPSTSPNNC